MTKNAGIVDGVTKVRVATFFMDNKDDIAAYEKIRNNEGCRILKVHTHIVTEKHNAFEEGKLVASDQLQRVHWIVEYEEDEIR